MAMNNYQSEVGWENVSLMVVEEDDEDYRLSLRLLKVFF